LRGFLSELDSTGDLKHVTREVSPRYEIAALAHKLDGKPLLFEAVRESEYRVAIGVCGSRALLARALGVQPGQLLERILESIEHPRPYKTVEQAPCQEVVEGEVDL